MANKAISELPQALNVNNQDLFVLEQSGIAKKLTAETFITEQGIIDALAEALDGHGGISSVTLSSVSGRIRTYLITFTDETTTTFQVLDGTSIDRIVKTSTAGLTDTYTVFMSDGTTTFFTVTNGADGTVSEAMLNDALKDKAPAVTETTESSAIANFTDGADDLVMHNIVAEIEPVQDLHGQSGPYLAGGGANVWDEEWELGLLNTTTGETVSSLTQIRAKNFIPVQPNTTYYNFGYAKWTLPYGSDKNVLSGAYMSQNTSNNASSIAGNTTFTTPANCYYIRFYLNPGYGSTYKNDQSINYPSTVTTYSPYSNICPITGWTGCNVTRTGKNLFDESQYQNLTSTYEYSNDSYHCKAIHLAPNTTFTVSHRAGTADSNVIALINNVQKVNNGGFFDLRTASGSKSFTTDSTGCLYIGVLYSNDTAYNARLALCQVQIELGSTATAYEPYITPTTASLSWQDEAGTVYGGTIDVATGLLTVTKASYTFDGSETFIKSGSALNGFYTNHLRHIVADSDKILVNTPLISNSFKTTTTSSVYVNNYGYIYADTSVCFSIDPTIAGDTVTAFTTWLSTNNVQVVYELATPQTYQLTGQQLKTLYGTNNVWADTGNVSVTYPADTKMYIQNLTQPTEDDMTANQAISSGKFFMVGNNLYIATAAIASGAKIIEGTNATRLSLADALNRL